MKSLVKYFSLRPIFFSIVKNSLWLFGDKLIRLTIGLLVSVMMIRHFGPERFGLLSYVIAYVSLFSCLASLGLNGVVVRELSNNPKHYGNILGSTFFLQLSAGILSYLILLLTIYFIHPPTDEKNSKILIALLGICLIFKSSDVIRYWFESLVTSKFIVIIENIFFCLFATVKLLLIYLNVNLLYFILTSVVEAAFVFIGFFWMYKKLNYRISDWTLTKNKILSLLKDSAPILLSSVGITIYMRIDQLMLSEMIGNKSVGVYSSALRISEIWYLIPSVIMASSFPVLLKEKLSNSANYQKKIQNIYNVMFILSFSIAFLTFYTAPYLIDLLYGAEYLSASSILMIHIWTSIFVFFGTVGSSWYLSENLQKLFFYRTIFGAIINILLNLFLIPKFGVNGAAISTLISQAFTCYFSDLLSKSTYLAFKMKTKAIFLIPSYFLKILL